MKHAGFLLMLNEHTATLQRCLQQYMYYVKILVT